MSKMGVFPPNMPLMSPPGRGPGENSGCARVEFQQHQHIWDHRRNHHNMT